MKELVNCFHFIKIQIFNKAMVQIKKSASSPCIKTISLQYIFIREKFNIFKSKKVVVLLKKVRKNFPICILKVNKNHFFERTVITIACYISKYRV